MKKKIFVLLSVHVLFCYNKNKFLRNNNLTDISHKSKTMKN